MSLRPSLRPAFGGRFLRTVALAALSGVALPATAAPRQSVDSPDALQSLPPRLMSATPTVSIANVSANETQTGQTTFSFAVTMSETSLTDVTVDYMTSDDTAADPSDYVAVMGTLTIMAGDLTGSVDLYVNGDMTVEPDETFFVDLTAPVGATLDDDHAVGTILNDDSAVNVDDVSVAEGMSGTTTMTFTVSLSLVSLTDVTVDWATSDGTASMTSDYTTGSGTVTIMAGMTSATFDVSVAGDTTLEDDETVIVTLGTITGDASLGKDVGTGTITNDDEATIDIDDVAQSEGDASTTDTVFTVTLSQPSPIAITVAYASANGGAVAPGDYTADSGTLTFAPSETTKMVAISVNGDTTGELDETFYVDLGATTGPGSVGKMRGVGTILNDDGAVLPTLSIADASVAEGDTGTATLSFTVTLSAVSAETVTVAYDSADGTAVAPGDYAVASGVLTFDPGDTSKSIDVSVAGDVSIEADETLTVTLSAPDKAALADATGGGTITNDDTVPTLSIADAVIAEGDSGTTTLSLTVTLSSATAGDVTMAYATAGDTATEPGDYLGASGTLTIVAGMTTGSIDVTVNGDTMVEADETFNVTLLAPSGATLADDTGVGTIMNDDFPPVPALFIDNVSVTEGNVGDVAATFSVTLSSAATTEVTVDFASADDTAVAPGDYQAASGTLTLAIGETAKEIAVTVHGDTAVEADEAFTVTLSNPVGASIGDMVGDGTILDDDAVEPTPEVGPEPVPEPMPEPPPVDAGVEPMVDGPIDMAEAPKPDLPPDGGTPEPPKDGPAPDVAPPEPPKDAGPADTVEPPRTDGGQDGVRDGQGDAGGIDNTNGCGCRVGAAPSAPSRPGLALALTLALGAVITARRRKVGERHR